MVAGFVKSMKSRTHLCVCSRTDRKSSASEHGAWRMGHYRKLWFIMIAVLVVTFSLLGYYGTEVYRQAPPIPGQVVSADGKALFTQDDILDGQTAWQSVGDPVLVRSLLQNLLGNALKFTRHAA